MNGNGNGRPWILKYWQIISTVLGIMFTGTFFIWQNRVIAQDAKSGYEENKITLKEQMQYVQSVPHMQKQMDDHVKEFQYFRNEVKQSLSKVGDKLDYIIKQRAS